MIDACPFCHPDPARVFYQGRLVIGIWDLYPVSSGHALLITRRHVSSWFEATADEQQQLISTLEIAKRAIECEHRPDGYNIGVNIQAAAGQTVPHLHIHLIPRYTGDVEDPTGGVRNVVPHHANYLLQHATHTFTAPARLVRGQSDPLLPHLLADLDRARDVDLAVAFVLESGVRLVREHLRDRLERGGRIRLLTGDYLGITSPEALYQLLDLQGHFRLRVFETEAESFHPKAYIFFETEQSGYAYIGSSNLTEPALKSGVEWNLRVDSRTNASSFRAITGAFEDLFSHPRTKTVDEEWIESYRRRRPAEGIRPKIVGVVPESPQPPPEPNSVQREALAALEATRSSGYSAGLVVLATGLGKTWLSAFDSNRPDFRRVLFVAHREEILAQACDTFRRIRPQARLGFFTGGEKDTRADVLFASIQTIGRAWHLSKWSPSAFDYIIVDEFHHAAARTYRNLLGHFRPGFLLGLTATPDRTDRADLLALCQHNLVYQCDFLDGINRELLCPFKYYGVPDDVDYSNIPWRSSRFDEEKLTSAVATVKRAQNALEQFEEKAGARTLGFCCSQRHADFMADFFTTRGVKAASVHAGSTSSPRAASLEKLQKGDLQIVFSVDMFNEGVDLPNVDTVMMLRPTESSVIWTQQMGRGLRRAKGKDHLRVIDYIGNHRVFLLKIKSLLEPLIGHMRSDFELSHALQLVKDSGLPLPPGCGVTYDLVALDIISSLLSKRKDLNLIEQAYRDLLARQGERPTASQILQEGFTPRSLRRTHGSWFNFVNSMGDLSEVQQRLLSKHSSFLSELETTPMTKSYKMLVLISMLDGDAFPGALDVKTLANRVREIVKGSPELAQDFGGALENDRELSSLLIKNPIDAWAGGKGTGGQAYFRFEDGFFKSVLTVQPDDRKVLQEMVREIAEWRLAEYLNRLRFDFDVTPDFLCKVSHAGGRPMMFLPDRNSSPDLPTGWMPIEANGEKLQARFVKVALNVVTRPGSDKNVLSEILRGWFGPQAGLPGTNYLVSFRQEGDRLVMRPVGQRAKKPELWRNYSREEIPGLFGFGFSQAVWNKGFVVQRPHLFLLVTLDKQDLLDDHQYQDRFMGPDIFLWQSQNQTTQASAHGKMLRDHQDLGLHVHLFVRRTKKTQGRSAPFRYFGEVQFLDWKGEKPITIRWRLPASVPEQYRQDLDIPA
jgi:superfamily II DNA or RNA helicase/diadenosine tetraphosphate (Ap4A) HIT family hydrolase